MAKDSMMSRRWSFGNISRRRSGHSHAPPKAPSLHLQTKLHELVYDMFQAHHTLTYVASTTASSPSLAAFRSSLVIIQAHEDVSGLVLSAFTQFLEEGPTRVCWKAALLDGSLRMCI